MAALPSLAVDHLIEWITSALFWRCAQHSRVGGVAERERNVAAVTSGNAENRLRLLGMIDRGDDGAYAKLPGRKLHVGRRLADVEHEPFAPLWIVRRDDDHTQRRASQMAREVARLRELREDVPVG